MLNLCPSSGCMWWFLMILSSSPYCQCLSILRLYVMHLNDPVKLTWPFFNLCPSSVCMWWFSMILSSWPDNFPTYVHPQGVCNSSQWSCQVDLTISQSLCIHSLYVMVLNDPVKLTWLRSLPMLCPSPACMWWFPMILSSLPDQSLCIPRMYAMVLNDPVKLTWPFPNLCPSSEGMW